MVTSALIIRLCFCGGVHGRWGGWGSRAIYGYLQGCPGEMGPPSHASHTIPILQGIVMEVVLLMAEIRRSPVEIW